MTRFKTNKRVKLLIIIFLAVMISFKTHILFTKHVHYKKLRKPLHTKKLKKKPRTIAKIIHDSDKLNDVQVSHEESVELHNRVIKHQRDEQEKQLKIQQKQQSRQNQIKQQQNNITSNQGTPVKIKVSYYTNNITDCSKTDGVTTSGKHIQNGMIAAPSNIPFGTKIQLGNMGTYTVQDRGGAISNSDGIMRVDVYVPNVTEEQLNKMGTKIVNGYILK